jgi:glycosyltransferase involved in cell wall biosynthesis
MLPDTIQSLERQTFEDFELIIVDDGSKDGTKLYLESLLNTLPGELKPEQIRVETHETNKRLPSALNTGFSKAQGDYLTWVSSDCWVHPYFLEYLVKTLEKHPEHGMAFSDFFLTDHEGRIINRVCNPHYSRRSLLLRNDGNASFLYRRSVMENLGDYDTDLEGAEDWDYWIQMSEITKFVYIPESLYYYKLHGDSMQQAIPDTVNESVKKMMGKTLKRYNFNIDMRLLYPSIVECQNEEEALFAAYFDFGTALIKARVFIPALCITMLQNALRIHSDNVMTLFNITIAHTIAQEWQIAESIVRSMPPQQDQVLQGQINKLMKIIADQNIHEASSIPIFQLDSLKTEVLQKDLGTRTVYSPTREHLDKEQMSQPFL